MGRGPDRIYDEYLVVLSQSGAKPALAELVARWSPRLTRYAAHTPGSVELAEDTVQETWAAAIRGLRRLDDPARFPGLDLRHPPPASASLMGVKPWFWMELQKNAVVREVKRLELQVARLAVR